MASSFYDKSDKSVTPLTVARASDINTINDAVDSAFVLVEASFENVKSLSVSRAEAWAENPEDVELDLGKGNYSALHHSAKASAQRALAETARTGAETARTGAQTAQGLAEDAQDAAEIAQGFAEDAQGFAETARGLAETARDKAQDWAEEDEDVEVEVGKYSAKHWAKKSEMFASGNIPPSNDPYSVSWDESLVAPTKNVVYDKFESLTKSDVGLSDVDNTSDLNKPISTATQSALDGKANTVHVHDIDDVTGLQSSLDNKSDDGHGHIIDDVTGLQLELDGKEPSLGDPAMDGYVLSSTTAGVRSWVEVSGGGLSWSVVATNTTAEEGNGYLFDNSSAVHTLTLPASPTVGDTVAAGDLGGDFATYPLTIARNGANIMGVAKNLTLNVRNQRVTLVYSGATEGWVITDEERFVKQPPVVTGVSVTGNIMGFNLSKTGANQVTVSKGSCLDSTLTVPLALTANTAVAIPAVANTIYHIFVVRLVADGSMTVKAYTSEAAVASDGTVDKWRWIGWWKTAGAAACSGMTNMGEYYLNNKAGDWVVSTAIGTTYATVGHSAFIPESRVELIEYGVRDSTTVGGAIVASDDGANISFMAGASSGIPDDDTGFVAWGVTTQQKSSLKPYLPTRKFKSSAGTLDLLIHAVKVRR